MNLKKFFSKFAIANDTATRLVSGIVMGVGALLMTLSSFTFGILCITLAAIALYEWYGMVDKKNAKNRVRYTIFSMIVILFPMIVSSHMSVIVGLMGLLLMGTTFFLFLLLNNTRRHAFVVSLGIPYIGIPMNALAWIRSDYDIGLILVLYIFAVTWLSDTCAYFVGRRLQGPKLAPKISPNKTWSGFWGACCGSMLAGALFSIIGFLVRHDELLIQVNFFDYKFYAIALFSFCLGAVAQVGDLLESFVKWHYKVKDSGAIIPGHGGVLDRVDGLLFVAACVGFVHYCILNYAQATVTL